MAKKYRILHTIAGPFTQGQEVTDLEISKAGHNVEHWLGHKAIEAIPDAAEVPGNNPAQPASAPVKPVGPANVTSAPSETAATLGTTPATSPKTDAHPDDKTGNNADPADKPPTGGPRGVQPARRR